MTRYTLHGVTSPVAQHVELCLAGGAPQLGQPGLRQLGEGLEGDLVPLPAHVDDLDSRG